MGPSTTRTIRTRILIISDTHCTPLTSTPSPPTYPFRSPLPEADLLLHCGDLTNRGLLPELHTALDLLSSIPCPTKLIIAGNHDLSLDPAFTSRHSSLISTSTHSKAVELWTSERGRARTSAGVTFLNEGVHQIVLGNGARLRVYASPWTPEYEGWGFMYPRSVDRFNGAESKCSDAEMMDGARAVPSFGGEGVDIMITHGPPWKRLDLTRSGDSAGCWHLLRAMCRARPLVHAFGHIHEGWGAEKVRFREGVVGVPGKEMRSEEWKEKGWKEVVEKTEKAEVDLKDVREKHGAFLDLSGLERGKETMLVNASIMDVDYKPSNAAWLIELDLPAAN